MRQRLTNTELDTLLLDAHPQPPDDQPDLAVLRQITATPRPRATQSRDLRGPWLRGQSRVRRQRRSGARVVALAVALVLPVAAIAGGAGMLLQAPKVDHRIPAAVTWRYVDTEEGPALQRLAPAWLRAENDAAEAALRAKGYDRPRCGIDLEHPAACFNPDGTQIDEALSVIVGNPTANRYIAEQGSPESLEIRHLSPAEASAWLAAHPKQRPDANR